MVLTCIEWYKNIDVMFLIWKIIDVLKQWLKLQLNVQELPVLKCQDNALQCLDDILLLNDSLGQSCQVLM